MLTTRSGQPNHAQIDIIAVVDWIRVVGERRHHTAELQTRPRLHRWLDGYRSARSALEPEARLLLVVSTTVAPTLDATLQPAGRFSLV